MGRVIGIAWDYYIGIIIRTVTTNKYYGLREYIKESSILSTRANSGAIENSVEHY
jgi:hypothetical protein